MVRHGPFHHGDAGERDHVHLDHRRKAYVDGMRFVQFYFGLPIAMVILSATAVPIFHRAKVYTAYEYLEQRFDAKTRALVTVDFSDRARPAARASRSRGARPLCCRAILGWPFQCDDDRSWAALVILYTTMGGIKAITWADVQQMIVIMARADPGAVHRDSSAAARCFVSRRRAASRAPRASSTPSICTSIGTIATTSGAA